MNRQQDTGSDALPLVSAQDISTYTIYIPSPVERAALNRIDTLWPKTFSAQRPLIASKLPLFYRTLFESSLRSSLQLGAAELALVRNWSMDANTDSIDSLKASLLVPVDQIFGDYGSRPAPLESLEPKSVAEILKRSASKNEGECSLFRQERLFRIAQAWPQLQQDAAARYRSCAGPDDLIAVWFDVSALLFSAEQTQVDPALKDSVSKRLVDLQQKGSPFDAFMAERLSQAAFLKSTHGS